MKVLTSVHAPHKPCVIDTNVLVCANDRRTEQASPTCVLTCVRILQKVQAEGHLVLDRGYRILNEYKRQAREEGQPGVGDAFLKWALTNWSNSQRCTLVAIAEHSERGFEEFPSDEALEDFDPSDRKFVAVSLAHGSFPPILNAVDTDWRDHQIELESHGFDILFLCPDAM